MLSLHNPEMYNARVAIVEPIPDQDEDAGPTEEIPVPTTFPYHCYINSQDTKVVYGVDSADIGKTPVRVFFPPPRPPVRKGYRIIREEDGRAFRAMAPPEPRGGVMFMVNCDVTD